MTRQINHVHPSREVLDQYEAARTYLARRHSFYASILLSVPTIWTDDRSVPIGATDGKHLFLNPDGCAKHVDTFRKWLFLLIHEGWHIAHLHAFRRKDRNPVAWNIAADHAINPMILEEHDFEAIEGILNEEKYKDHSPEQIYGEIIDEIEQKQMQAAQGSQSGSGTDSGQTGKAASGGQDSTSSGTGSPAPSDSDQDEEQDGSTNQPEPMDQDPEEAEDEADPRGEKENLGDEETDSGNESEEMGGAGIGDEAGTTPRDIDLDWLHGDVIDPRLTMDDIECEHAEAEARQLVHRAALHAQAFGTDTRIADAFVESIRPKQPWQAKIATFVSNLMDMDDYTWARPRQRYIPQGVYLPSLGGQRDPKLIAIAVDVSGSISEDMLKEFFAELSSLVANHPRITYMVYYVDTEIQREEELTIDDLPIEASVVAGGGTNFRPAFDRIEELDLPISGLIYFTDLGANDYGKEPGFPVIWLNFSTPYSAERNYYGIVPWGEVVNMRDY